MRKAGQSSRRILLAFKAHASSSTPRNRYDPLYAYNQMDFTGESYMLNPHELIANSFRWKPREVAEYIALASFRSYAQYTVDRTKTLDLLHSPVGRDTLNNNRLLWIKDDKIHFYYEEDLGKRENI